MFLLIYDDLVQAKFSELKVKFRFNYGTYINDIGDNANTISNIIYDKVYDKINSTTGHNNNLDNSNYNKNRKYQPPSFHNAMNQFDRMHFPFLLNSLNLLVLSSLCNSIFVDCITCSSYLLFTFAHTLIYYLHKRLYVCIHVCRCIYMYECM